jgi:hydrogenase nickel incorporation protein HypA/HybF
MHEASIALSVIDISEQECRRAGLTRVDSVSVRVGAASGVLPDALLSAFDIVKIGTIAAAARLIVTRVPLGGFCRNCRRPFSTQDPFILSCPSCGARNFSMNRGRELDVVEIEAS